MTGAAADQPLPPVTYRTYLLVLGAVVGITQIHQCVVVLAIGPISLELQHGRHGRHPDRSGLNHS